MIKRTRFNPVKLIRMAILILFMTTSVFFAIKSTASGLTMDSSIEITVKPGDSLWSISKQYNRGENIQKVLYSIMETNNMRNSDIFPGQKLKIPSKY